jgi:hypothetical protein
VYNGSIASFCGSLLMRILATLVLLVVLPLLVVLSGVSIIDTRAPEPKRVASNSDTRSDASIATTTGPESPAVIGTNGNVAIDFGLKVKPIFEPTPAAPPASEISKMQSQALSLKALPVGKIVLRAPKEMKVGDVRQVDANVGLDVPLDVLTKDIRSEDQKLEGSAHLSAKMEASLVGVGFKITPLKPDQQTIAIGFPSVWSWSVEAKEQGDQELEATLYPILSDGRQRVDSYTQKINVNVREKTWGESFEAFAHEFDAAKSVAVGLFGLVALVAGWFGYSLITLRKKASRVEDQT